jgi:biotin operon repressor
MSPDSPSHKAVEIHITSESGPLDDFNPFVVTRQKWVPELLYLLNEHPLSSSQISSALKISRTETSKLLGDLTRIQAVKQQSGIYSVAFPIFSRDDIFLLKRASEPIAREISAGITDHKKEIDSLAQDFSSFDQVGSSKLLFAAVGCFALDWLCLKILQEDGVLIKSKRHPGNRDYLLIAREQVNPSESTRLYGKMYWGSSSDDAAGLVFATFGDQNGIRYAFPDVM